jgi:single-strand DNA-binding protein
MSSQVTIIGNLTKDPETKTMKSGATLTNMSVAVNRSWKNKEDAWEEQTSFFDVTAWSELAENIAASLKKGSKVIVTGRLEQQTWEKDGQKHSKVVLIAEDCGPSLRKAQVSGIVKVAGVAPAGKSSQTRQTALASVGAFEEEPF